MGNFIDSLGRYLKKDELARIANVRVGIAGAGGLGSNLAMMLVRTGFTNIRIADFDIVDISNLNRQFYFSKDIGKKKVDCIKENLRAINPDVTIETFGEKLTAENIKDVFTDCQIVAEAFDKAESKRMLLEAFSGTSKYVVSVSGIAGYADADEIITHRLKEHLVIIGDLKSDITTLPPLSPRVMVAAAKEANVILSWALTAIN